MILNYKFKEYKRGNRFLLVFPDIPFWLVLKQANKNIIEAFQHSNTIEESLKYLSKNYDLLITQNIMNAVINMYQYLNEKGIVSFVPQRKLEEKWNQKIVSAGVNITKNCNLNCSYCFADANHNGLDSKKVESLTKNDIKKYLDGVKKYASDNCAVQFTGGEPLLNRDLFFYGIQYARKIEIPYITVNTNGILLDDHDIYLFKKYGVNNVTVSLDGLNADKHDFIRGKGTFSIAKKALLKLKKSGLYVTACMTIHADNINELIPFLKFCYENNIEGFTAPLFPLGRGAFGKVVPCKLNDIYLKITTAYTNGDLPAEAIRYSFVQTISTLLNRISRRYYCCTGTSSLFLDIDGSIYPCANTIGPKIFLAGNIKNQTFDSIWINSKNLKHLRNDINLAEGSCSNCDLKYLCSGFCRGLNYQVTKSLDNKSIWCEDIHETIINGMWFLADHPNIFSKYEDKFLKM